MWNPLWNSLSKAFYYSFVFARPKSTIYLLYSDIFEWITLVHITIIYDMISSKMAWFFGRAMTFFRNVFERHKTNLRVESPGALKHFALSPSRIAVARTRWIRSPNKHEAPPVLVGQWIILSRRTFSFASPAFTVEREDSNRAGEKAEQRCDRPFFPWESAKGSWSNRRFAGQFYYVARSHRVSVESHCVRVRPALCAVQREVSGVTYIHDYAEIAPNEIAP